MGIPQLSSVSASVCFILCILASFCPIQCARRPEGRIIGGDNTTEGEYPHQVFAMTRFDNSTSLSICGGSILNEDHILTAAHCVANATPSDINFGVGKHDVLNLLPDDHYPAAEVILHPCYDQEVGIDDQENLLNDIAIVKLGKALPLDGRNIDTIQIDQNNLATEGKVTRVIGWGRTNASSAEAFISVILKKADLTVITSQCKELLGLDQFEPDGQICANSDKAFICEGDTGGPLLCADGNGNGNNSTNVVCGITSTAYNLDPNQTRCHGPSVFTRVYYYRDWINSVLAGGRNSSEGCIRYLPKPTPEPTSEPEPKPESTPEPEPKLESTPKPEPTPKPKTTPKPEPTTTESEDDYVEISRAHRFPSHRPSCLICGIWLILTFLSLWGR